MVECEGGMFGRKKWVQKSNRVDAQVGKNENQFNFMPPHLCSRKKRSHYSGIDLLAIEGSAYWKAESQSECSVDMRNFFFYIIISILMLSIGVPYFSRIWLLKSDFKGKHFKISNWGTKDSYFTEGIHKRDSF